MNAEDKRISELRLERYALGELSREEKLKTQDSLESDETLRARLSELERSDRDIIEKYPPRSMSPLILKRLSESAHDASRATHRRRLGRRLPRAIEWSVGIAAVFLVSLSIYAFRPGTMPAISGSGGDIVRAKGVSSHLLLFRKSQAGAEQLADGAVTQKGDLLQIGYEAGSPGYGAIFSIDGRWLVTFHLPAGYGGGQRTAPKLEAPGPALLPSAYELDDAPSFERFFFVYSPSSFDLRLAWQAARSLSSSKNEGNLGAMGLPSSLRCYTVVLKKKEVK
jgi:hypothetical protein